MGSPQNVVAMMGGVWRGLAMASRVVSGLLIILCVSCLSVGFAQIRGPLETSNAVRHDVWEPIRNIQPLPVQATQNMKPVYHIPHSLAPAQPDTVLQTQAGTTSAPATAQNFEGVGTGFPGFSVNSAPPDTNGAVGATQYVQWVNESFAVFNKATGAPIYGPAPRNTLWAGFGGKCETTNDGDPIVQYDKAADRWIMTQFAVSGGSPYYQCVAVS